MKYSIIVTVRLFILHGYMHRCLQAELRACMRERVDFLQEMSVTVSSVYVFMISCDSRQSLSPVKMQKGNSELHCKLSRTQWFSVEILKQNFKFIPFLLEAFGFTNELINFAETSLFNVEKLVLELLRCSKVYASWTWCTS